jgi:hypothetical protein
MSETYHHTQVGTLLIVLLALPVLVILIIASTVGWDPVSIAVLVILVACLVMFGTLTVHIDDGVLTARFGPGLLRRSLKLRDIRSATAVRNRWFYGWGIRSIPRGWLFNVSGLDAVELQMTNGRVFRIGTDEPDALLAAIRQAAGLTD